MAAVHTKEIGRPPHLLPARSPRFKTLYLVGVAPATYEEGLYFLPEVFAFLRRNPSDDGVQCVADVMWFISQNAARLETDGLLGDCWEQADARLTWRSYWFKFSQ